MKIGVVTFFNNGNYGSELQAYAMNAYLESLGHQVSFCKFKTNNLFIKVFEKIRDRIEENVLKRKYPEYANMRIERRQSSRNAKRIDPILCKRLSDFSTNHIKSCILPRSFYSQRTFDCWICGSDQIWSALKIPFQKERFLTRVPTKKKIAYAVSLGPNHTADYFAKKGMKPIKDFSYLSFREKSGCEYVQNKYGLDSELVLDPTMLVGADFWRRSIIDVSSLETPNSYCLCYFLGRITDDYKSAIQKIRNNKKLIVLAYQDDADSLNGTYIPADPLEFVKLIANASFVFTDSFHGTVFSVLLNKQFLSFERTHTPSLAQTNRITGLLDQCGITDHFYSGDINALDTLAPLDYESINQVLENRISDSASFLNNALNQVSSNIGR